MNQEQNWLSGNVNSVVVTVSFKQMHDSKQVCSFLSKFVFQLVTTF